jgi:hypothetical protein
VIPAVSDVLSSLALIMTGEVEARAVITRIEGRIEDGKVGRFPARLALLKLWRSWSASMLCRP